MAWTENFVIMCDNNATEEGRFLPQPVAFDRNRHPLMIKGHKRPIVPGGWYTSGVSKCPLRAIVPYRAVLRFVCLGKFFRK